MVAKLGLTFYMGTYLSLEAVGVYGLVFGAVMLLGPLLGLGLNYVVVRDIVGRAPSFVSHRIRDQAIVYCFNYILLGAVISGVIIADLAGVPAKSLWFVLVLSVLESYGTATYYCMNSLQQQVWANSMFCIRSGFWGASCSYSRTLCFLRAEKLTLSSTAG